MGQFLLSAHRWFAFCLVMVCCQLCANLSATAAELPRRTALVMGNAAYQNGRLRNPVNDATDIAATLQKLGFTVTLARDVDLREMEQAIDTFSRRLRQGGVGLFYFAGHGVQVEGENYLIPLQARIRREQDVRYEAVPAGRILGAMEDAGNGVNLVILDACRDNPFTRRWRSSQRGLASMQALRGSLIAYATEPGGTAIDGKGRNGLYTKHLLQHLATPGLSVELMFKQVRVEVVEATGGRQTPWESSSLIGAFSFNPIAEPATAVKRPTREAEPETLPGPDPEAEMWQLVRDSTAPEDFRFFLENYPSGRYAPAARLMVQRLQRQQVAAEPAVKTPPPVAPEPPRVEKPITSPATQIASLEPAAVRTSGQKLGRFVKYDNGTALDTRTNLMWMTKDFRNIEGRAPGDWHEAIGWAAKMNQQRYGGYSDWRVPIITEYERVYDRKKRRTSYNGKPVGYPEAFEDGGGIWFWTNEEAQLSTTDSCFPNCAWAIEFQIGNLKELFMVNASVTPSVRLVRQGR